MSGLYGVLCESDCGIDSLGNPTGKPMIFECTGEGMQKHKAIAKAESLKAAGKFGDVKVFRLEVCNCIIKEQAGV